ncbi:hypothetical protein [Paraburkholderia sp. C35]|uniref:hypothetical protein n=1 Tax=Paraburkholderia sp. C35 TaxID=2126993 RepID=UPI0013A532D7|nr:hypothetical protein [Paraburkholderia sp. C35]
MADAQFNEFAIGRPQVEQAMRNWSLIDWTNSGSYSLSAVTYDANGIIASASILWPSGAQGQWTTLIANARYGVVDSFACTYVYGNVTRTVTQPAVSRNGSGAITSCPALILS